MTLMSLQSNFKTREGNNIELHETAKSLRLQHPSTRTLQAQNYEYTSQYLAQSFEVLKLLPA
eukprot:CAMPEP_0116902078 /NCGR_PEP_ID=MMETSP0467-20121206/9776_1 /TAXON_ID=283647 /ORGANISM="Mesodinium pulex, Strain SPMC105" /LENGTH=61 /DNA_ID=CAMNT_0004575797 /DNA_START=953 /DNA_END=1138 /DNA_ORIENTATION=-